MDIVWITYHHVLLQRCDPWFASLGNGDEMPPAPQRGGIVDESSDKESLLSLVVR